MSKNRKNKRLSLALKRTLHNTKHRPIKTLKDLEVRNHQIKNLEIQIARIDLLIK